MVYELIMQDGRRDHQIESYSYNTHHQHIMHRYREQCPVIVIYNVQSICQKVVTQANFSLNLSFCIDIARKIFCLL